MSRVRAEAKRFNLPPQLLAATMYAEMRSYNVLDSIQDAGVQAIAESGYTPGRSFLHTPIFGSIMIAADLSFGPAKIRPSRVLDPVYTVPALEHAGVGVPADSTDAAVQSLDFDRAVQFAAGHLKGLANLRKGDYPGSANSRESDMTKVDMQVVRVAYTEKLDTFWKMGNQSYDYYQTTTYIVPGGYGAEASSWLDAFAELYGN